MQCNDRGEIANALTRIFQPGQKGYDYVAIAQKYIYIKHEYRVVSYNKEVAFVYEKIPGTVDSDGNISPLHTLGGKAVLITDPEILNSITTALEPLHRKSQLNYGGLDLVHDTHGKWWLLEVNSAPSYTFFIRHNGDQEVISLYKNILNDLARVSPTK